MIIDAHIHIGKWSGIFFNYESNVEDAVKVMKKAGVEAAVCMPADNTSNDELFNEIKKFPDFKFYFNAWINPDDKSLDNFLKENLKHISLLKIHPSIQKRRITDISFEKYLRIAEENNKPVIVHCGRWQEIAGYSFALEAAEKYRKLNLILAHMGGDQPSIILNCAGEIKKRKLNNVYLGTESVREFYFVNEAVKMISPEKIIFGSDYNLGLPEMYIPVIDSLKINSSEKELIFSGNILRLMSELN
ncbi:MAG: hypothetical protein HGGPFJEG_01220 [Ignavibacteria bacterium]|nr:hypothetical protein [Ignavibacteria bacterium]